MGVSVPEENEGKVPGLLGEGLVALRPVTVRRRVVWGDCDPAGVVYTPRFADYLALAFSWFQRVVMSQTVDGDDFPIAATPMKALSLEFHRALRPGEVFDMRVLVAEIRERTFDLEVTAWVPEGGVCFVGQLSPIAIDRDRFVSMELPVKLREALTGYRDQCADVATLA